MRPLRVLVALLVALSVAVSLVPAANADPEEVAAARARATEAAGALSEAESRLGELETQIAGEEQRLADAEAQMAALDDRLAELAVDLYVDFASGGGTEILVGENLNEQLQRAALTRLVSQRDLSAIEEYRSLQEDAGAAREALDASRADQEDAVAELRQRRQELESELARLEEIERQRLEEERRQQAAAAAAAAIAARSQSAAAAGGGGGGGGSSSPAPVASAPSTPIASGSWICPVQGPVAFVDSWGAPRSGGRRHQGVDMMSPTGTPTVAPVGGRVEHRGNSIGGLSWHLYGDDGHYYYGTHLSAYANQGAGHVAAGTVIGYVGSTGNASAPHLHFEIHPNGGAAVNPYPTVAQYC
ncbi:MAG: murein hydrolase activator EnvC family protein [Acidimicrobiales bacterium]